MKLFIDANIYIPFYNSNAGNLRKLLATLAEIHDDIIVTKIIADEVVRNRFNQFKASFITNLINYIPVTILSKITGHSLTNKNVVFSYNKISLLDNAVMFVKELKTVQENYGEEFSIGLV